MLVMEIMLSGINNVQVLMSGKITEIDYQWFIKPIISLFNHFQNNNEYFDRLFEALYKLQNWAKEKHVAFKLKANNLFKSTYYFFCKSRENEK